MDKFGACLLSNDRRQRLSLKENGRKVVMVNRREAQLAHVRVDGCYLANGVKCDHLVIFNKSEFIYVELKGSDIKHGLKQISETIPKTKCDCCEAITAILVTSRVPRMSTQIQRAKLSLRRDYGAIVVIKSRQYEHILP